MLRVEVIFFDLPKPPTHPHDGAGGGTTTSCLRGKFVGNANSFLIFQLAKQLLKEKPDWNMDILSDQELVLDHLIHTQDNSLV